MNHLNFLKKAILGLCLLCLTCVGVAAQNAKPFVIPELKEFRRNGNLIEARAYHTVHGIWTYFKVVTLSSSNRSNSTMTSRSSLLCFLRSSIPHFSFMKYLR